MKDEPPPGDVIYEKDSYAIHQLDGEDHKVGLLLAISGCLSRLR